MSDDTPELHDIDYPSHNADDIETNRRITVRYIREDIKATLSNVKISFFGAPLKIELLDLSTKGALVLADRKIRKNKKLTLILEFQDGRTFAIDSKVIRLDAFMPNTYGLKFNSYNDALGDYILKTQTDLIFK